MDDQIQKKDDEVMNKIELEKHGREINWMYFAILSGMALLTAWSMWQAVSNAMYESMGLFGSFVAGVISVLLPAFFEAGVIGWWDAWEHVLSNIEQKTIAKNMTNWHIGASVTLLALNLLKAEALSLYGAISVDGKPVLQQFTDITTITNVLNGMIAILVALMACLNIINRRKFREHDTLIQRRRAHAAQILTVQNQIDAMQLQARLTQEQTKLQVLQSTALQVARQMGTEAALESLRRGGASAEQISQVVASIPDLQSQPVSVQPVDTASISVPAGASSRPSIIDKAGKWLQNLTGGGQNPPTASIQ